MAGVPKGFRMRTENMMNAVVQAKPGEGGLFKDLSGRGGGQSGSKRLLRLPKGDNYE
jgi:hypothetical protein